jgi:CDP-diacylglycerol--serine O-phosphatidyltransferase
VSSRLARFHVTAEALSRGGDRVNYFEGTPIPTSVLLVPASCLWPQWRTHDGSVDQLFELQGQPWGR